MKPPVKQSEKACFQREPKSGCHCICQNDYFEQTITVALAGRAAEETILNEISSGALDDLEKATREAYSMVADLGFNKKVGMVSYFDPTGRSEYTKPYSETTATLIDKEVRTLLESCYERHEPFFMDTGSNF